MANLIDQVHEMQGLYGPFTLTERVVQKIWLRQDFDAGQARLLDGRTLTTRQPGRWNLLAGPDFRGARLLLGDREVTVTSKYIFMLRIGGHMGTSMIPHTTVWCCTW